MKRIIISLFILVMILFNSCNQIFNSFARGVGVLPKYRNTEESLDCFKKKVGYEPDFFAYANSKNAWSELYSYRVFPSEEFYNAQGQKITYDSTWICPGSASKFVKALGSDTLEMQVYENESIDDLLEKLEFAPEMAFDPAELGKMYDYAMFVFFFTDMINYFMNCIKFEIDSALANPYKEVAIIPVCLDGNSAVFESNKAYKRFLNE